uniref:Uncharacterized protein n=1 Tax=Meloidogyne floridensis TaxID=298350 RepID=A0A915NHT1_9BILA
MGSSSASQVVLHTATHTRIIGQHPPPAFQHQTLGPPQGFEVPRLALRPEINVQTRPQRAVIPTSEEIAKSVTGHDGIDQDLQQHDNQIVEYTNPKEETTGKKKIKWDSGIDAVIAQCFNDGLTAIQAEKEIIGTKGINISLSAIEHRFKESDTLILKCFNDGLTPNQAEKKIIEKKGKNWTLLSAIKRRFEKLGKELREEFVIIMYLDKLDAVILQCFNDGLTAFQAKIVTKGINISLSTIVRRYDELEKLIVENSKSLANLLNSKEGSSSANQSDKASDIFEGDNEAEIVEATGSDYN